MIDTELKNQNPKRTLAQWLFNPFQFIAGSNALLLGVLIMLATAYIGSWTNTHFDGVLDVHNGLVVPLWVFFVEVIIDWLCISVVLFIIAFFVSRSSFRAIDVFGTQALARAPHFLTVLAVLPSGVVRVTEYLVSLATGQKPAEAVKSMDIVFFVIAIIVMLLMIIWVIILMYKAYTVSCNIKGKKAAITFTIGLISAEIVSKILIVVLLISVLGMDAVLGNFMPHGARDTQNTVAVRDFENDPQLIGAWQSVDFVDDVNDFQPVVKRWRGELYLKELTFKENGWTSQSWKWTKDWIYTYDGEIKAQYHIKSINGELYLFFPWLSGDVTIRGMEPCYYVLKKVSE